MLVDSRASSNFLASRLAAELEVPVKSIPTFTIEVGNGQKEKGTGMCCDVLL